MTGAYLTAWLLYTCTTLPESCRAQSSTKKILLPPGWTVKGSTKKILLPPGWTMNRFQTSFPPKFWSQSSVHLAMNNKATPPATAPTKPNRTFVEDEYKKEICPPGKFSFPDCNKACSGCHVRDCHSKKGCVRCQPEYEQTIRKGICPNLNCRTTIGPGGEKESYPCRNGGECQKKGCQCPVGFQGTFCEDGIDTGDLEECERLDDGKKCQNSGRCYIVDNKKKDNKFCKCVGKWTGRLCEYSCRRGTDNCLRGRCNRLQTCTDCDDGFTGHQCDTECPRGSWGKNCRKACSHNCRNDQECDAVGGECDAQGCVVGYTGKRCETRLDNYDELREVQISFSLIGKVPQAVFDSPTHERTVRLRQDLEAYHIRVAQSQQLPPGKIRYPMSMEPGSVQVKYTVVYEDQLQLTPNDIASKMAQALKENAQSFKSRDFDLAMDADSIVATSVSSNVDNKDPSLSYRARVMLIVGGVVGIAVVVAVVVFRKGSDVMQQNRRSRWGGSKWTNSSNRRSWPPQNGASASAFQNRPWPSARSKKYPSAFEDHFIIDRRSYFGNRNWTRTKNF